MSQFHSRNKKSLVRPISNMRDKVGRIFIDTYKNIRVTKNRARTLSTRWTLHSPSRIFTAAQFNGSASKISFKNAPLKEDHWKNDISVRDGETGGGLKPPQSQAKKKPNESSDSELQDFKIFWGTIPPDSPTLWRLRRSLMIPPPILVQNTLRRPWA